MDHKMLTEGASVSSSLAHFTDLSSSSNNFPSIRCNLSNGLYADAIYTCQNNPKLLKKLNFVVCSERSLEIHESEKTYRKKKRAKIIIDLSTVYGLTKRTNKKVKCCLMLVTPEQTFYLRAPTEIATSEWHTLLINNIYTSRSLLHCRQISYSDFPEDVWDVNLTTMPKIYRRSLESHMENLIKKDKRAAGRKRLCFFPHAIIFLQMHADLGNLGSNMEKDPSEQDPENYFYFPRPFISHYGALEQHFFIRSSTPEFGTCGIVMDCGSITTADEIYHKFTSSANKNCEIEEKPWQEMFGIDQDGEEDQEEEEYYRPQKRKTKNFVNEHHTAPVPTISYCTESPSTKKPVKEVRFKTEEQPDMQPMENVTQKSTLDDGEVGQAIMVDMIRRGTPNVPPPPPPETKKLSHDLSSAFTGIFATVKRKLLDRSSPPSTPVVENKPDKKEVEVEKEVEKGENEAKEESEEGEKENEETSVLLKNKKGKEGGGDLKQWAENRASFIEDETEDSGGTLKPDDPLLQDIERSKLMTIDEQRSIRRDELLAEAMKKFNTRRLHKKVPEEAIEMKELCVSTSSFKTDESVKTRSTEISNCDRSSIGSDSSQKSNKKELKSSSNSSLSGLDSCISNTSEDFSAASSVSNVEYTWKPIMKLIKTKKLSLDTNSISGGFTNQVQDNISDMSADSCYSSLTNNGGYQQLPKSQSLTQFACCETSSEADKKSPTTRKSLKLKQFANDKNRIESPMEEAEKSQGRLIKSAGDIASDFQRESLRSKIKKVDDEESLAAAIRQRAASMGNKTWAVTPLGQSIRKQRHRQDCKRRKNGSSTNNSVLSEEQPLLGDPRHSSISSQSEQSFSHRNALGARSILAQAYLRKNPTRSNAEDLAEVTFVNNRGSVGGSLGSMNGSETQRETIQAFGGTNKALIPTRYSDGANTTSRHKANRARRQRKEFDLEVVECFLNAKDLESNSSQSQKAGSSSSRESVDNIPRCRHGKPKRHHHSNHAQDLNEHRHSSRRKHRTSCQDAIVEEDCVQPSFEPYSHIFGGTDSSTEKQTESSQNSDTMQSEQSSQKSDDLASPDLNLDLLNNNPNPVTIFA